jgi:hypothetical protein
VYSTKPCPSSSTTNLLRNSITLSPPFFNSIDCSTYKSQRQFSQDLQHVGCRSSRYYASNHQLYFSTRYGTMTKLYLTKVTGLLHKVSQSAQSRSWSTRNSELNVKIC